MPSLEIRRLTPPLVQDYLALFDAAFTDHPGWSSCYCLFYHSSEEPWREGPEVAADHRAARIEQLARGEVPGYLAYRDGRPVGWLNAGPRQAYQSLRRLPEGDPGDALVMCFVVLPEVRNQGVASALLDFALSDLASRGMTSVQAYPPARMPEDLSWEAASYKGPLSMYLERGFTISERGGRPVARRRL